MKKVGRKVGIIILLALFALVSLWQPLSWAPGVAALAAPAKSAAVGAIAGEFSVDGNGGAEYIIAIEVPPGTNGVEPTLYFSYNSEQGNDLLGMGWQMSGLSAITRCNQTLHQDDRIHGVDFSKDDRFCLDGQRLIAVEGAYGEDGTEYRTERESWTRIYSHGSAGGGPQYFTAVGKNGDRMEFGKTEDSRIEAPGRSDGSVRVWAINKVTDRNGNYVTANYIEESDTGVYYAKEIEYTGNAQQDPQRAVKFDYEGRSDAIVDYIAGSKLEMNKRLKTIETYVDLDGNGSNITDSKNLVKRYSLSYEYGKATGRSRLQELKECDRAGVCLPATQLSYTDNTNSGKFTSLKKGSYIGDWSNVNASNARRYLPIDMNGDGLLDLVEIFKRESDKTNAKSWGNQGNGNFDPMNSSSSNIGGWSNVDANNARRYLPMDANGDGLEDLAEIYQASKETGVATWQSQGDGSFTELVWKNRIGDWSNVNAGDARQYLTMDVNGDGLKDIVELFKGDCGTNGATATCANSWLNKGNGELAAMEPKASKIGDWSNVDANNARRYLPMDVNGDGLEDLVEIYRRSEETRAATWQSQGDGSFTGLELYNPIGDWSNVNAGDARQYLTMDVNRDGMSDIVEIYKGNCGGKEAVACANSWASTGSKADILTKIVNGLGGEIAIEYKPLTDNSVYTKGSGATGTQFDVQPAMYVVSQHTVKDKASNPTNEFVYEYKYEGAREDRFRGWLGFEKTIEIDRNNETKTITTYNLNFPLLGTIAKEETLSIDGDKILGKEIKHYDWCSTSGTSTDCSQTQGKGRVYKEWITAVEEERYIEGRKIDTLRQEYEYDSQHQNITVVSDLRDEEEPEDDAYTCLAYGNDKGEDWWKSFFPIEKKIVSSKSDCGNWRSWKASTNLSWQQLGYDANMNITSDKIWKDTDSKWLESRTGYDSYGNVTSLRDPLGNEVTICYDSTYHTFPHKQIAASTSCSSSGDSGALTVTTTYEPKFGHKTKIVDPNGNARMEIPESGIDGFGRVLEVWGVEPNSSISKILSQTEFQSESSGGMSVKTWYRTEWNGSDTPDATWLWEQEYIDGLGRAYKTESKGYNSETKLVSEIGFNAVGEVDREYLPYYYNNCVRYEEGGSCVDAGSKRLFRNEYNIHGYLTKVTAPNNAVRETIYQLDQDRQITQKLPDPRDPANGSNFVDWASKFNSQDRISEKSDPNGGQAVYKYDRLERPVEIIDPLGVKTTLAYNSLGEVVSETMPETGIVQYTYTDNGQLSSRIDAKNQKVSFEYDGLGREIAKKIYNSASDSSPTKEIAYIYDEEDVDNGKGELTAIEMPEATYRFAYDNTGQVKEERVEIKIGNQNKTFITRYTYDAAGRFALVTYPDGAEVRYQYRDAGELGTIDLKESGQSNFITYGTYEKYTALGQLGKVSYGNGTESNYTYDAMGRLATSETKKAALTLRQFSYSWNKADKIEAIEDKANKGLSQSFEYDKVGNTIEATGPYGEITYSYDKGGNITSQGPITYLYDSTKKHQLIEGCDAVTDSNCSADATSELELKYDEIGNTTEKIVGKEPDSDSSELPAHRYYSYDAEGQLLEVEEKVGSGSRTQVNQFTYDDAGDRLTKEEADGTIVYYISGVYEVVLKPSGEEVHTKYLVGPQGVVAAIGKVGEVSLISALNANTADLAADMSDPGSWKGLMSYLSAKANQLAYYPYLGTWLIGTVLAGLLLFVLLLSGYCIWRTSPRESWVGRERSYLLQTLVKQGWLLPATAKELDTPIAPNWLMQKWHRPWVLALALVSFTSATLYSTNAWAAMTSGANGQGYPVANQTLYFHHDHLGSTILITDESGAEVSQVTYEPYGQIDQQNSSGSDNFRPKFTGKEFDSNSDLYYFGARYYDAHLGRFLTPDPAEQYYSPYAYGPGDPLIGVDPDGEGFISGLIIGISALIGAFAGGAVMNESFNPASWDWSSGKTWGGIVGGGILGGLSGGAGVGIAGGSLGTMKATAAIMAVEGLLGGVGDAYFTALAGGSASDIGRSFGIGLGTGALFAIPGVGDVATAATMGYNIGQMIANPSVDGGISLGLDILSLGMSQLDVGKKGSYDVAEAGMQSFAEMKASPTASCASSFAAETEVITSEGEMAVEEVAVGDLVWAYNEETGDEALYPVSHLFTRIAPEVVLITAGDEVIEATPEHEFYVDSKGWVEAEDLGIGDELVQRGGGKVLVKALQSREDSTRVYNIEVDQTHTYYVSGEKVLVHNPACKITNKTGRKQDTISAKVTGANLNQGSKPQISQGVWQRMKTPSTLEYRIKYTKGGKQVRKYGTLNKKGTGRPGFTTVKNSIKNKNPKGGKTRGWDKGHAIANRLGGKGNAANLFPQDRTLNRGGWRSLESKVYRKIQRYGPVDIQITLR